jgi:hypothetical protein
MFSFTFGSPGSGKSLVQADTTLRLIKRSLRVEKKYKKVRTIWINFHLSPRLMERYKNRVFHWTEPLQMIFEDYPKNKIFRRDFDCVWDEMAVELPADGWKDTPKAIRKFFAQHRKRGIEIYGNTQDYKMVDINARRMAHHVFQTFKLIGSRDPSATLPPIKFVWGLIASWELERSSLEDDSEKKRKYIFPHFVAISKWLTQAYDTAEDINEGQDRPLYHMKRKCIDPDCDFVKIIHI